MFFSASMYPQWFTIMYMQASASEFQPLHVIDSHTSGEPTQVVVEGGPDLGEGELQDRWRLLREYHDDLRTKVQGRAWIPVESTLLFHPSDPLREGVAF
jgi:proline racemase